MDNVHPDHNAYEGYMRINDLIVALFLFGIGETVSAETTLDTGLIERTFGVTGYTREDVFRISLPRTDLSVSLDGLSLKPKFALKSWIAFKGHGDAAVAHGDLVLLENEVEPVIERLHALSVTVLALHNHLIGESPHVMYLHFWAEGTSEQISSRLADVLTLTATPLRKNTTPKDMKGSDPALPIDRIESLLQMKGVARDGVLTMSVPRMQAITMNRVNLPSEMGMASTINFQAGQKRKIAATGDFVLLAHEVNPVASTLTRYGLRVTAIHNYLLGASPDLYALHFWGHDSEEAVTRGLKATLDVMQKKP